MQKVVLASGNCGKLAELQAMLQPLELEVIAQSELRVPEAEETGITFVENALIKARNAAEHTGLPAIADDSGLAVDALDGAPGVRSARYASADANDLANNRKLLQALAGVPDEQRDAQFHCAVVYLRHAQDPVPIICHGVWPGRILRAARGAAGFGYDPLFWVPEEQASSAELSKVRKNRISHRGRATRALILRLRTILPLE